MEAKIYDINGMIEMALKTLGFNANKITVELVLNVINYVKMHEFDITLNDLKELKRAVESLVEE